MSSLASLDFQNACSPLMEQLIFFHNHTLMMLSLVIIIVAFNMGASASNKIISQENLESHSLEMFWTIAPGIILLGIGMPSIKLLYLLDEVYKPSLTMKAIGHQWYWSYEISEFNKMEFDSFMISSKESNNSSMRLLEVDNRLVLPVKTQIRNLVTSMDVLHSWTIPSLGVKVDAIPGRLNQVNFYSNQCSIFYGQCSEICGANHSFMPIVVEMIKDKKFISWVNKMN